jgi:hypothetical protein
MDPFRSTGACRRGVPAASAGVACAARGRLVGGPGGRFGQPIAGRAASSARLRDSRDRASLPAIPAWRLSAIAAASAAEGWYEPERRRLDAPGEAAIPQRTPPRIDHLETGRRMDPSCTILAGDRRHRPSPRDLRRPAPRLASCRGPSIFYAQASRRDRSMITKMSTKTLALHGHRRTRGGDFGPSFASVHLGILYALWRRRGSGSPGR